MRIFSNVKKCVTVPAKFQNILKFLVIKMHLFSMQFAEAFFILSKWKLKGCEANVLTLVIFLVNAFCYVHVLNLFKFSKRLGGVNQTNWAINRPNMLKLSEWNEFFPSKTHVSYFALSNYGNFLSMKIWDVFSCVKVAIGRRFGIDEPQLMKIMKATLYTHNEWFKLQMCKDRFEGFLRISSLKEVGTSLLADAASRLSDTSDPGSSQATMSSSSRVHEDVGSPAQISSSEVACDENAILKVMVSQACFRHS